MSLEESDLRAKNAALKYTLRRTGMALALAEAFMAIDASLHHRVVTRLEPQDRFESVCDFRAHVDSVAARVLKEEKSLSSPQKRVVQESRGGHVSSDVAHSELLERLCPSLKNDLG